MKRFPLVLLLILGLVCAAAAGEKLRYKFVTGTTYRYQIHSETKAAGSMGGTEFTADTKADMVIVLVPSGPATGGTEVVASLESARSVINVPVMGLRDSSLELKELLGKRMKVVISELGKAVSIVPIDTVASSQILMMSGISPNEIFRRLFLQLPEAEVEANGSWKDVRPDTTKNNNILIVNKPDFNYQVQGTEKLDDRTCLKIAVKGKTVTEGSGNVRGMDVTVDGTANTTGTVLFAPADGVMVSFDSLTEIDQTQTFSGAQTGAQTMVIKVTNSTRLVK